MTYTEFALQNPVFISLSIIILSLCVGSFLNVVIHRVPVMLNNEWTLLSSEFLNINHQKPTATYNLITPQSSCPNCKTKIKPWHNIPVLSYLWLKGKCSACSTPISIRYPLVELATAALSFFLYLKLGPNLPFIFALVFCWVLIALTMIDFDTQLLPDSMTIPLIWLGLMVNAFELFIPLKESVFSAVGAYVFLWSFVRIFKLITGKDGMGEGDFKLFSAFGAWFGWQALPLILVVSSFAGAVIGIVILKSSKQDNDTPLAFGPYLCIAAYLYMLYGQTFMQWYLSRFLF